MLFHENGIFTNATVIDDAVRFISMNTSFGKEKKESKTRWICTQRRSDNNKSDLLSKEQLKN